MSSGTFAQLHGNKDFVTQRECTAIRLLHHQHGVSGREIARWLERQDKCIHRHMNGRCGHGGFRVFADEQ